MSEMHEWKDMEDMIKRVAEKEPLPESLAPEEIEKKLKAVLEAEGREEKSDKTYRKNRRWKRRFPAWATLVAACLALLVAISVVLGQANLSYEKASEKGVKTKNDAKSQITAGKEELEEVLVGAASEEEIYERIDRIKNPDKYKSVGERIFDGISGLLQVGSIKSSDLAMTDGTMEKHVTEYSEETVRDASAYSANAEERKESDEDYSGTNLQELGVDEADVVKTDGKYFYIKRANENEIAIVRVEGEQLNTVSQITLPGYSEKEEHNLHEFYVSGDRLVLLQTVLSYYASTEDGNGKCGNYDSCESETRIQIYDISDRQNPRMLSELCQDGSYDSSRMNEGYLYTFSDHYIYNEIQEDVPESFMPCAEGEMIACQDIYLPEKADDSHYKVITSVKLEEPEHFQTEKAVLCGSGWCYVSTNAIYFLAGYYVNQDEEGYNTTEIWKFSYQDGNIIGSASGMVKGDITDQFAMSEADGYLRVVTTYEKYRYETGVRYENGIVDGILQLFSDDVAYTDEESKNGLFILDENLNVVGSLEDLAPGERIYSARFFADTVYFVTFRLTDPLFSVDVSDPANPVLLGELKIPGFSEYLHPYGDGLLLGIGYEADENGVRTGIKLSMFDVSDPANVKEIAKETVAEYGDNSSYSSSALCNHKAVLVDVEKNLVGLNLEGYIYTNRNETYSNGYVVYGYDEEQGFFLKNKTELTGRERQYTEVNEEDYEKEQRKRSEIRGAFIGNYFYTINEGYTIQCFDMDNDFALKSEYEY